MSSFNHRGVISKSYVWVYVLQHLVLVCMQLMSVSQVKFSQGLDVCDVDYGLMDYSIAYRYTSHPCIYRMGVGLY